MIQLKPEVSYRVSSEPDELSLKPQKRSAASTKRPRGFDIKSPAAKRIHLESKSLSSDEETSSEEDERGGGLPSGQSSSLDLNGLPSGYLSSPDMCGLPSGQWSSQHSNGQLSGGQHSGRGCPKGAINKCMRGNYHSKITICRDLVLKNTFTWLIVFLSYESNVEFYILDFVWN